MTAAGRLRGLLGEPICPGCSVPGFGTHACYGEAIRTDPTGQAIIADCVCAVYPSCRGHFVPRATAIDPRFASGGSAVSTTPRHGFVGDWPAGYIEPGARRPVGATDTGVRYLDELCPSCDKPITTTGECRCSS